MIAPQDVPAPNSMLGALECLMGSPASRPRAAGSGSNTTTWSWPTRCSGRAATPPSCACTAPTKALAISCDVTPRYCAADPYEGAKQAVAECWRNLTAVGADPLAITDCMNFGNPERPEIMGEFAGAIEGMAEACTALDLPVVSGNVSLYNETNGVAIPPTPGDRRRRAHPRHRARWRPSRSSARATCSCCSARRPAISASRSIMQTDARSGAKARRRRSISTPSAAPAIWSEG